MSFISFEFLAFLAALLALYGRLGLRGQNRLLLVGSYFFYGWWDWRFLGLILLSSLVDFACGARVGPDGPLAGRPRARKHLLWLSLGFNLGLLGFFKYFGFFVGSLQVALATVGIDAAGPTLEVVLPVGISFYTFQTLSYTLDRYRGQVAAVARLDDFLLYVSFFPQLVAGPIERARAFVPQVVAPRKLTPAQVSSGALLALFGFAQKMVVADNLAPLVEATYRQAATGGPTPSGAAIWLATVAFAVQIYADFAGYTDIARGVARMFGFELSLNFRMPYFSSSPSEFWTRWHISLSSWLRDYLYIPLGGNRGGTARTARNLWITMLLGGLWHGAAWHFVLWGAWHGLLLSVWRVLQGGGARAAPPPPSWRPGRVLAMLGFFGLTCVGWLLFRIDSAAAAPAWLGAMLWPDGWGRLPSGALLTLAVFGLPLLVFDAWRWRRDQPEPWQGLSTGRQVALIVVLFYAIVLCGSPHATQFLYFQF